MWSSRCSCCTGCSAGIRCPKTIECRPSGRATGVIVVLPRRLQEVHRNAWQLAHEFAGNDWSDDQAQEYDEHDEVKHSEADDPALP